MFNKFQVGDLLTLENGISPFMDRKSYWKDTLFLVIGYQEEVSDDKRMCVCIIFDATENQNNWFRYYFYEKEEIYKKYV